MCTSLGMTDKLVLPPLSNAHDLLTKKTADGVIVVGFRPVLYRVLIGVLPIQHGHFEGGVPFTHDRQLKKTETLVRPDKIIICGHIVYFNHK